jgi:NTE family protein
MMLRHLLLAAVVLLAGCATLTRQVNPPITEVHPTEGYRFLTHEAKRPANNAKDTLVVLTFSGGGTRAAAFAYGVLEVLRRTEITMPDGRRGRLIDGVDIITGVSGGSFTALAYGLYGDKLFDTYEKRFLKRNVESALLHGVLDPTNWYALSSDVWGRSEMAAQYYDEILFDGATFADLERGNGPFIMVQTTDISTGSRFAFTQPAFDLICSDL